MLMLLIILSVLTVLALGAQLLLTIVVLLKDSSNLRNRAFFLLSLSLLGWAAFNFMYYVFPEIAGNIYIVRIVMFFAVLQNTFFVLFSYSLRGEQVRFRGKTIPYIILSIISALITLSPFLFSELAPTPTGELYPTAQGGMALFLLHALISIFLGFRYLFMQYKVESGLRRRQMLFILFGSLVLWGLVPVTNLILSVILQRSFFALFSPMYAFVFSSLIAYAVIKHKLFDIRVAVVRTIAYAGVLITLGAIYYVLAYVISHTFLLNNPDASGVDLVSILLALFLAFLFQPIKHFFDRITNNIFFRDRYKAEDFFAKLSGLLASTTELRSVLERASIEIASTLKAEQAFFFLYYSNGTHHHMSSGTQGHSRMPIFDSHALDVYVAKNNQTVLVTDMLPDDTEVRRMLISHKIALVMPLKLDRHIIGYFCLGGQRSGGYTDRDLKVLATIEGELVIAIQNALSVHEVREINATLKQRIDVATKELRATNAQLRHLDTTKDEFVSMASHQLRTPLTSVKGYISMVMEGDAGKISDQQHSLLSEAFESSERMVRLINDFLSVSRLQTGRFVIEKREVDIGKVVGQEVESLRSIAGTHGVKLAYKAPHTPQMTWCDEDKIRQVIMNFIDNAIYYSRADSTIHVTLDVIDYEVVFTVRDTGIGVPIDAQPRLFTKFFRAGNARRQRPDGTGVGLFLAKKVITEHRGQVIFSSVENQGSLFGFRIPLVLDKETDDSDDQKQDQK